MAKKDPADEWLLANDPAAKDSKTKAGYARTIGTEANNARPESPTSAFDGAEGDDGRTWDEKGIGRELWDREDDWTDHSEYFPGEPPRPRRERISKEVLEASYATIQAQIDEIEAGGRTSFGPDEPDLEQLYLKLDEVSLDLEAIDLGIDDDGDGEPDRDEISVVRPRQLPFEAYLFDNLTPPEAQHWRWLVERRPQTDIRGELGISQQAVSKREKALRVKVDHLHRDWNGKPYPFVDLQSTRGGRPRRA
jgi:hypothetical protein